MILYVTDSLFAWDRLDDSPQLRTIQEFFELLPDGQLIDGLVQHRGKGRDDCPVRVLWFCVVLQRLLRHPTMRLTLEELSRNADLRRLGGMEHAEDVPKPWNISRFLGVLGQDPFRMLLQEVFDLLVQRLGSAVPDLGLHSAGDATHLSARRRGRYAQALPAPDGGHKEYSDQDGKVTEVLEWFGYKLHLLCDTRHEVALAYTITPASHADNQQLEALVQEAETNLPEDRIESLAYDKACDDKGIHEMLDKHVIKPVIQQRSLWKDKESRTLENAGIGNIVYDEAGTVYCYDMQSDPPVSGAW